MTAKAEQSSPSKKIPPSWTLETYRRVFSEDIQFKGWTDKRWQDWWNGSIDFNTKRIPASPPTHTGQTTWPHPEPMSRQVGGDHYKSLAIEPLEFCQRNRLDYAESLDVKYICRHKLKGGRTDIEKAIHCLEMLLEIDYGKEEK